VFRRAPRRVVARRGRYLLTLDERERELIRSVLAELRALLAAAPNDPRVRRLYPDAYASDPEAEAEYRRLTQEDLKSGRLASIEAVEASLGAAELSAEQLTAWMQAVNALRLVLGTMLDVSEDDEVFEFDPDNPDARNQALYAYLGVLLEEIVEAQLGA
jgi:Domain of unknown function (DUF2017)